MMTQYQSNGRVPQTTAAGSENNDTGRIGYTGVIQGEPTQRDSSEQNNEGDEKGSCGGASPALGVSSWIKPVYVCM
jgi:hypothetical protein